MSKNNRGGLKKKNRFRFRFRRKVKYMSLVLYRIIRRNSNLKKHLKYKCRSSFSLKKKKKSEITIVNKNLKTRIASEIDIKIAETYLNSKKSVPCFAKPPPNIWKNTSKYQTLQSFIAFSRTIPLLIVRSTKSSSRNNTTNALGNSIGQLVRRSIPNWNLNAG